MAHFELDGSIRPQDDLFRHVNGRWLASAEIPADKPGTGAFVELRDDSEKAIHEILTDPSLAGTKPSVMFASFMDEQRADSLGIAPLADRLAAIDALATTDDLWRYFGSALREGVTTLAGLEVEADPGDPHRYALYVGQSGLGLPDEAYYRLPEHADILARYRTHVGTMLGLVGADAADADSVVDLETEIARHHWDNVRTRDIQQMYNPMTPAELDGGRGWLALLQAAGAGAVPQVVNCQPSFFADVAGLVTLESLPAWRAWARYHLVEAFASYLSGELVDASFAFHGTVLQGIPQLKDRWKRGVALVQWSLGEEVGKIYVARHFPPSSKQRMDELVANLVEAYRRSIADLDWMTEATKAQALDKLSKFTPKIGYPDVWRDYGGLEVTDDLVENVARAVGFEFDYQLSKLAGPVQPWEWLMTPQTVNAYYHPFRNEIVFPAAILQPPFFDPDADDAVNYGAIGAVIGHEIGHGFDDQGSTCDGDGALRDWWTEADREAFAARTRSLIGQYDALHPAQLPDRHVNGALTIGENIGDLGGLGIALLAWRLATAGQPPSDVDGQRPAERFFYSWALAWQSKRRDEALAQQIATDPHSPEEFRCNQVVRNLDAFHDTFGVTEGDRLWLAPQERVKIW